MSFSTPAVAGGVYFVKAGDTLGFVSRLFGVEQDAIRELNKLTSTKLQAGAALRIPDPPPQASPALGKSQRPGGPGDRVLQSVCREEKVYHAVVKGDTLTSIAGRYDTDLDTLLRLNALRKTSRLSIGQRLVVRVSGPRSHTVARGETIFGIAARYGVKTDDIRRLNQLPGDTIVPGRRLVVEPCDPFAVAGSAPPPLDGPVAPGLVATSPGTAPTVPADGVASGSVGAGLPGPGAALAGRVVDLARTMLNVPYRFGGSTLRGIDCSAYVQRVFGLMDISLPRTAREQFSVGARIDRDELQVGDLIFFRTYSSFPSHVGIYLGENLFIHASAMVRKVAVDSIDMPYYRKRFIGARRLLFDGAADVASAP